MTFGLGEFFSLSCALVWAIAVILFKKSGEHLGPFALNLVKNAMVLPLFLVTVGLIEGLGPLLDIPPAHVAIILLSGFIGIAAGDTLYFHALNTIGTSRIAAAQTLYSPFVIALSMGFLGERLSWGQLSGVLCVLAGIALVTYTRAMDRVDPRALRLGMAAGVVAVFMMALGVVMAKPMLEAHDFLWVVTLRIVGGLAGMAAIAVLSGQVASLRATYAKVTHWRLIFIGGLTGTYISMMLWLAGYKYTQASIAAVLNELAAIFILVLTVMFLDERVTRRQWLGTLVAIAGVVLVVTL